MRGSLRVAVLKGVIAVLVAGCGGDGDGGAPPPNQPPAPPPRASPVALYLDRRVAAAGSTLELTVENRGRTPLEFGVAYRLERWDGRWRWLNRDQAFILTAAGVRPGERYEQKVVLPDDLAPGRYRVAKSFTERGADRRLEGAAQFDVR